MNKEKMLSALRLSWLTDTFLPAPLRLQSTQYFCFLPFSTPGANLQKHFLQLKKALSIL
jgi:hypothetical protein